jgi:segregation and condensation protein B
MTQEPPTPDHSDAPHDKRSPLSLNRLREAFAEMLNAHQPPAPAADRGGEATQSVDVPTGRGQLTEQHDPCEINPRSVVEAMLFVGYPDNRPLSAREMAAAMRGVSPTEIEAAVAELNALYRRDAAPYEIVGSKAGYRLALRDDFGRMRDKLQGRIREAKLSPPAVEVLSIVAYNQPISAEAISQLRGVPSGPALATLVRRKLVRLDRPADSPTNPQYSTTERFLRLFGLESVAALPRSEEIEKS